MIINILLGTAFLIAPNTVVLTAHQIGQDTPMDVIVREVQYDEEPLPVECRELKVGENVFTMGYPHIANGEMRFGFGKITEVNGNRFKTDMALTKGFSGAPVFAGGKAVGVVTHGIFDEDRNSIGSISTNLCEVL